MKRWRAILLCLLVGAVVNVLVAWACELWSGPPGPRPSFTKVAEQWPAPVPPSWPEVTQATRTARWFGVTERSAGASELFGTNLCAVVVYESGWPLRALRRTAWCWQGPLTRDATGVQACRFTPALALPSTARPACEEGNVIATAFKPREPMPSLSLGPLWPGFALNTLLYTALPWGAVATSGLARRRRRLRRGLCGSCGYDREGLNGPCPECGTPREAAP